MFDKIAIIVIINETNIDKYFQTQKYNNKLEEIHNQGVKEYEK